MIANRNFGNYEPCQPLTWIGKIPIYLATVLAGVQAATMVITALLMSANSPWLSQMVFSYGEAVRQFKVWQFVTYAFVNPPNNIWVVLQLFMFAWFGRDVERFLGRKSFVWLCGLLVLAAPVFLTVLGLFGLPLSYAGSNVVNFSIFLAFALINPRAEIIFTIEARWVAIVLLAYSTIQCLAFHSWTQLMVLWVSLGVAAAWLKYQGVASLQTPALDNYFEKRHSARRLKLVKPPRKPESGVHDSIDPILEKIAKQGIGSLSRGEREKLERARAALLEKERRG